MHRLIALSVMLIVANICFADTVYLKNGRIIEGVQTWEEDGMVCFYRFGSLMKFPSGNVDKIDMEVVENNANLESRVAAGNDSSYSQDTDTAAVSASNAGIQQTDSILKIVKHEPIMRTNVIGASDMWWHIEGQIYNPSERGATNVIINYPQFDGLPPVKIPFVPPKQTVDFKSDSRASMYGMGDVELINGRWVHTKKAPVTVKGWRSGGKLIANITNDWE